MGKMSVIELLVAALAAAESLAGMDIKIPVGTPEGGGAIPLYLRWDDPATIPDIPVETIKGGRMEVVKGEQTFIRFYRDGVEVPVREYVMTPGETVFSTAYNYMGKRKYETKWTFRPDGWCYMDKFDADGTHLAHEEYRHVEKGNTTTVQRKIGGVFTEKIYEKHPTRGGCVVFEAKGTGPDRVWTRTSYYYGGIGDGRIRSEIDSSGHWAIYEYCEPLGMGSKEFPTSDGTVMKSFWTSAKTVPVDGAKGITNEQGVVVSFTGKARRTEYRYDSLFPEDNDKPSSLKPRLTVVYEVYPDGTKKEIEREYQARCIDRDKQERLDICEVATVPGAPFGAPTNKRTVQCRTWSPSLLSTSLKYSVSPEGVMHVVNRWDIDSVVNLDKYSYDGRPVFVVEGFDTTTNAPSGTPYQTVIRRGFHDPDGRLLREEQWILLPEGERELLSWKNIHRDNVGRVTGTETSGGERTEKVWEDWNVVSESNVDGLERRWRYDAIGRLVQGESYAYEHNLRYDLGSLVTNAFGSVFGERYNYGLHHDDAGRLTDVTGEPGEKFETRTDSDGVSRTWVNGRLIRSEVTRDGWTTVYEGPRGLDSPRWRKFSHNYDDGYSVMEMPRLGGGVVSVTNRYGRLLGDGDEEGRLETETMYKKVDGCWWREETTVRVGRSGREVLGGRRERVSARRKDGGAETVTLDAKGNATHRLVLRDAQTGVSTEIVRRPTSAKPEVCVTSNRVTILTVSSSGVTNLFERGFQGRLVSRTDGRGGVTRYEYDGEGRCVSRTDRCGGEWFFVYDRQGRRTGMTLPSGETVRTEYDDFGRIESESCAKTRVSYEYDEFGDLVAISIEEGGKKTGELSCFRDEATGLLTNRVVNGSAVSLGYSPDNELRTVGGIDIAAARAARTNGLEIAVDDFGRAVGYSVNGVAKLRHSYDPDTGRIAAFSVDGLGEVRIAYLEGTDLIETLSYPGGVSAKFEYDAEDSPLRVAWSGLPEGPRIIEASERKEWSPPDFDDECDWNMLPIASDTRIYALDGTSLANPVAEIGEDGSLHWCLLGPSRERLGTIGGEEARQ